LQHTTGDSNKGIKTFPGIIPEAALTAIDKSKTPPQ
jgi:hypothetical protein